MRKEPIAVTNRTDIIKMVEQGIELSEISRQYGITPSAISNQLAGEMEYKVARVAGLEAKLSRREAELESATDQLEVSRGRELLKLAQWKLERLVSDVYGNQPKIQVNIGVDTTTALEHDCSTLVAKIKGK